MAISYEGIAHNCVTMKKMDDVMVGTACAIAGNDIVKVADEDENIIGVAASVRGEYAGVIISGVVTLPYSGNAPGVGYCPLAGTGNGKVQHSDGGIYYRVLNVDKNQQTVTFIL